MLYSVVIYEYNFIMPQDFALTHFFYSEQNFVTLTILSVKEKGKYTIKTIIFIILKYCIGILSVSQLSKSLLKLNSIFIFFFNY